MIGAIKYVGEGKWNIDDLRKAIERIKIAVLLWLLLVVHNIKYNISDEQKSSMESLQYNN